jgi:MFS family permease
MLTALVMARLIPRCRIQFLFFAGALFLLCAPLLMVFSPANQSYWPQSFPAVALSAIGGMTLFNVSNVFVASAVALEDQALGQGIFNTVVQIGTAVSLALAATVAHAGGVTANASRMELLHGYRNCFWLCVGILIIPLVGVWFLKGRKASELDSENTESSNGKSNNNEGNSEEIKIEKA